MRGCSAVCGVCVGRMVGVRLLIEEEEFGIDDEG